MSSVLDEMYVFTFFTNTQIIYTIYTVEDRVSDSLKYMYISGKSS